MATFYPSQFSKNTPKSELEALNALKSLNDDHHIFHSTNWFNSESGEEGEGDIIILNRTKGIIVIEVKGGAIEYRNGEIRQINTNTLKYTVLKDPFKQANRTKHYLIKLIKKLASKPSAYLHSAVWFTSGELIGELPIAIDKKSVLTQGDLYAANYSINDLYKHISEFDNYNNSISKTQFDHILNLLAPSFSIIKNRKYDFDKREQEFLKFTQDQTKILDLLEYQKKAVIEGSAGTGKSVLAMQKAERLALNGEEVLFICYNDKLCQYFEKQNNSDQIKYETIYSLMSKLTSINLHDNFEEIEESFLSFMMDDDCTWNYNNVIIDEAQDFKNEWLEAIELRTKDTLYIFYDPNQNLYSEETPKVIGGISSKFPLITNCRNTKEIAYTAAKFLDFSYDKLLNQVNGEKPKYYETDDINQVNKIVKKIILESINSGIDKHDIAVLTMKGEDNSEFAANKHKISNIQWTDSFEKDKVNFTTVRKFKGLEAKVLIIVESNLWRLDEAWRRKLLYMSYSRARHELHVISTKHEISLFQEILENQGIKSKDPKSKFMNEFGFELINQ